jgi:hypothetical protein
MPFEGIGTLGDRRRALFQFMMKLGESERKSAVKVKSQFLMNDGT